ncbi:MAG: ATP-dependent zinc metalloprotease FtsH [Acidobacteriota bacterium]
MSNSPQPNPQNPNPAPRPKPSRANVIGLLLSFGLLMMVMYIMSAGVHGTHNRQISYSKFKQEVTQGKVAKITLKGKRVTGVYKAPKAKKAGAKKARAQKSQPPKEFKTYLPAINDSSLMPLLEKNNVAISAVPPSSSIWSELLIGLLPWVVLIGAFFYITYRMQRKSGSGPGGIFGFGKSKAKKYRKGPSDATFEDVAGLENAKRDLQEVVEYLRNPRRYVRIGAKLPRGILLMGPPGTGKTLLAKAVAGEADAPFFSISGSEFVEMFVGVGASRVRDLFETAKKEAPAVIFIDEIDSVGRSRGAGLGGGNDEREQTLNQILSEMDGFSPWHAVIVIAATNRPDVLDAALLRPGRFDRKIAMELPRKEARRKILQVHTRLVPLAEDVDLDRLARQTVGFSGADLENLINEAALLAGRDGKTEVGMDSLERARDRIVLGNKRDSMMDEEEKRRVAIHESGHALLACLLPHTDPLERVSIIPRGRALGVTEQLPEEERYNLSESYLRDRIGVMLGGRVAERLVYGEASSGAENDLQQATGLARRMVSRWGMSEKLGPVAYHREQDHPFLGREIAQPPDFSEDTARLIDEEVRALIRGLEQHAEQILREHRAELEAVAQELVEHEILKAEEIRRLLENHGLEVAQPHVRTA